MEVSGCAWVMYHTFRHILSDETIGITPDDPIHFCLKEIPKTFHLLDPCLSLKNRKKNKKTFAGGLAFSL